ncbi:MAG TPA: DUF3307 domain-containing protein [bacterium]|nr:DUF3307 domain-containing protein [bacterium]HQG46453.1 DUF3307 domain-containing protein [bacterium]HQI47272.1 DUF3307 domain-containing protein [bacterium]HQJ64219.1 DUF3307 domain-containing protein [bacterium]
MDYFQLLLLAHVIGDFVLQTDTIFRLKQQSPWGVPLHVLICSLVTAALLHPLLGRPAFWLALLFIALVHLALDRTKLFLAAFHAKDGLGYFFIDQGLHLLSLLGAARYLQWALPQQGFWLGTGLTVTLTALTAAGFAVPPILFYIQRALSVPGVPRSNPAFPSFRRRLPGILSRLLATLGLLVGGWYLLLTPVLLSALVEPMTTPDHNKRYLTAELITSSTFVLFFALLAWYLRAG